MGSKADRQTSFLAPGVHVAVTRVSGKILRAEESFAAPVTRHTHLVAELIKLARFAFCDALHFRLMNRVNLVLVVHLLGVDSMRCLRRLG